CLADVTIDMVGGANFDGYEAGKAVVEFAHMVMPGSGEAPSWRAADFEGEPVAIGLRVQDGVGGLNEVWRVREGPGAAPPLAPPPVAAAWARQSAARASRRRLSRRWPAGPDGPPRRP